MTLATIVHIFAFFMLFAIGCVIIQFVVNAIPYDRYDEQTCEVYKFTVDEDDVHEEKEPSIPVQSKSNSRKPKSNQQFVAGESIDSVQFSKRASVTNKQKDTKPSNIKEFTLPDGSVIYINTDKTEMEVKDASDYFK